MRAQKIVVAGLLAPLLLAGCLFPPGPRGPGVVVVPALPSRVVLGPDPYYAHRGYNYHYRDDGWYYSHGRDGAWAPLPRDRYPKEVKLKGGGPQRKGPDQDKGRKPGHPER
jgi:hypothetical protein